MQSSVFLFMLVSVLCLTNISAGPMNVFEVKNRFDRFLAAFGIEECFFWASNEFPVMSLLCEPNINCSTTLYTTERMLPFLLSSTWNSVLLSDSAIMIESYFLTKNIMAVLTSLAIMCPLAVQRLSVRRFCCSTSGSSLALLPFPCTKVCSRRSTPLLVLISAHRFVISLCRLESWVVGRGHGISRIRNQPNYIENQTSAPVAVVYHPSYSRGPCDCKMY